MGPTALGLQRLPPGAVARGRALWRAIDRERGLRSRARAPGPRDVRPRGRGLPDRLHRARRDCRRASEYRQGNQGTHYVRAAVVGRKARRPGQGQGMGRQTVSQMTESRPWGAAKEKPMKEEGARY